MVEKKTDLFIKKAKEIHGNKYDYNDVIYLSAKTKVIIRCKIHGAFEQTPTNHLSGKGCKKCSIENRSKLFKPSQENYIKQVRAVHGDRYDLSQIKYINAHKNIKVICHKHGAFFPSPQRFKKGSNCPKCNSESKKDKSIYSREDIITDFVKTHGNKYDYSKVIYRTKGKKVIIICKKHGEFLQAPKQHIKGAGCPHCAGNVRFTTKTFLKEIKNRGYWDNNYDYSQVEYVSAKKLIRVKDKSTQTYHLVHPSTMLNRGTKLNIRNAEDRTKYAITKMREVHKNTYDYSKVKYISGEPLIIICKIHGEFKQSYHKHVSGKGCNKCGNIRIGEKLLLSRDEVISDFKRVHGNLYDYTKVEYISAKTKVKIICKKHGVFEQEAQAHKGGQGCPYCSLTPQSKQELTITFELLTVFKDINPKGHKLRIKGKLRSIDIFLPHLNIGIEFDGSYWHKGEREKDKMKTLDIEEQGINIIRVRQKPLKRIFEDDVMAEKKFDGKQITNDILKQIMKDYDLDKRTLSKIDNYIAKEGLQNQKGLDEYIDQILTEKAERKKNT